MPLVYALTLLCCCPTVSCCCTSLAMASAEAIATAAAVAEVIASVTANAEVSIQAKLQTMSTINEYARASATAATRASATADAAAKAFSTAYASSRTIVDVIGTRGDPEALTRALEVARSAAHAMTANKQMTVANADVRAELAFVVRDMKESADSSHKYVLHTEMEAERAREQVYSMQRMNSKATSETGKQQSMCYVKGWTGHD